jgi:ribonuclease BN (tRNA processing enzyme)
MFSRLTFLGTGAGMPSPSRNVSGLALTFQDGSAWLFDCGEGTQHQLMRACGPQGQAARGSHFLEEALLCLPCVLCVPHVLCTAA